MQMYELYATEACDLVKENIKQELCVQYLETVDLW